MSNRTLIAATAAALALSACGVSDTQDAVGGDTAAPAPQAEESEPTEAEEPEPAEPTEAESDDDALSGQTAPTAPGKTPAW